MSDPELPPDVLAAWSALSGRTHSKVAVGNINRTFRVDGREGPVILQRLHPIFAPEVHDDIDAITRHLEASGLVTPRLVATDAGTLWTRGSDEGVWRALTFVEGVNVEKVDSPARAREAGRLVGRFHAALMDLEHRYAFTRGNVHDTGKHLARLEEALSTHGGHRLYDEVRPEAEAVLEAGRRLPELASQPLRHSHGDLKISNLMFDEAGRGLCLIDLDTLSLMSRAFELGDALRSWCNPRPEDVRPAHLEVDLFRAALEGYGEAAPGLCTDEEKAHLVDGLSTICLELSARFLDDALRESYFGFNAKKYATAGEHHLLRGQAMAELHRSVEAQRGELERLVGQLLRS